VDHLKLYYGICLKCIIFKSISLKFIRNLHIVIHWISGYICIRNPPQYLFIIILLCIISVQNYSYIVIGVPLILHFNSLYKFIVLKFKGQIFFNLRLL
jgi:hypothetical protein